MAPVHLTSTIAGSAVTLTWQPGRGPTTGQVYWLDVGSTAGARDRGIGPATSTTLVVSALPEGQEWVPVRTADHAVVSAPSNEVVARVVAAR